MTKPPNSDALSAAAPCKLSAWSPVFRGYLPGHDVTLLDAQHVNSSRSKRSRSNRNHNANLERCLPWARAVPSRVASAVNNACILRFPLNESLQFFT
jgi:hypothetical protein